MIIGVVSSDAAPTNCGVAAYVARLTVELDRMGHTVVTVAATGTPDALVPARLGRRWTMADAKPLRAALRAAGAQKVLFNWTPAAYGNHAIGIDVALLPVAVAWPRRCTVIVHEAESSGDRWFDTLRRRSQAAALRVFSWCGVRLVSPSTSRTFDPRLQVTTSPFGSVWNMHGVRGPRNQRLVLFASPRNRATEVAAEAALRLRWSITIIGDDRGSGVAAAFAADCTRAGVEALATGPVPEEIAVKELHAAGAVLICKDRAPDLRWTTMTSALASGAPTIVIDTQSSVSHWGHTIAGVHFPNLGVARNAVDIIELMDKVGSLNELGRVPSELLLSGLWVKHASVVAAP